MTKQNARAAEALISRSEAGFLLACSRETIRRLVARGVLEEIKFDERSHPRYRLADVLKLAGRREAGVR